ncbi:MAG: asparagine synthase (glutamine-hydrolyzing) [Phycisphaerales bacterium]|nr:asparagine synthase (glutamine-hydrolyzing) [Phycisphaerales bacterium]
MPIRETMCGILGILSASTNANSLDQRVVEKMRDRLTRRGPDDAGLWHGEMGWLAHRRLEVIDPTSAGHQPMLTEDGRYVIVYNGELYNDAEVRQELESLGVRFTTHCDTQTVLYAVAQWGLEAAKKLRGMYALVVVDTLEHTVILARDPMGIKPMYTTWAPTGCLVFGSEIPAILEHPEVDCRPDWITASAYLSSIRTTLGTRTMFAGIEAIEPGQWVRVDLKNRKIVQRVNCWDEWSPTILDGAPSSALVRETIEDSVCAHLRTDVPMCALLSGGLDSAILALIAKRELGTLRTYCAGAKIDGFDDDFYFARMLAGVLGTEHTEVVIEKEQFASSWAAMIDHTGVPMSTPNEVAIHAVAKELRAQGNVVALSGEGADELFGGYAPIMMQCTDYLRTLTDHSDPEGGLFHLRANAWIGKDQKPLVLNSEVWRSADSDNALRAHYCETFHQVQQNTPTDSGLQPHLRFLRRMNLTNLLQRLDTATMLASVEGRTPFADWRVAQLAESLPMHDKFVAGDEHNEGGTKISLREAFRKDLPDSIVNRPKQSFPMPFQSWVAQHASVLRTSSFARSVFTPEAIRLVVADPEQRCMLAWPMVNLALWGERWWGDGVGTEFRELCEAEQ